MAFNPFAPGQTPTSTVSEDTLHYTIRLPSHSSTTPESFVTLITSHVHSLLAPYSPFKGPLPESRDSTAWLWHKDAWELKVVPEKDVQDRRFVRGNQVPKVQLSEQEGTDDPSGNHQDASFSGESKSAGSLGRKLEGHVRIGDSVDDEWLVVWLLREVSKTWPELIISWVIFIYIVGGTTDSSLVCILR